jgi:hypothetical protein
LQQKVNGKMDKKRFHNISDNRTLPAHITQMSKQRRIYEDICALKHQILPDETVILFGSQARGDANDESDWDLLVLLNKPEKEFEDFDNYAYPFTEVGWEHGVAINPVLYTVTKWNQGKTFPFYRRR